MSERDRMSPILSRRALVRGGAAGSALAAVGFRPMPAAGQQSILLELDT